MSVRIALKIAIAAIVMGIPALTLAGGNSENVRITSISVDTTSGDLVFIQVSGKKSNGPSCSTDATYAYVLQMGSAISDALFRVILSARAHSAPVSLIGTGMCASNMNVEVLEGVSY